MAIKKYAYYNKGNKLAVIQQRTSDVSSSEYGHYKSPTESVTDGLEIEYTYAPTYTINTNSTLNVNKWYILGWTVIAGYLTFLRGMRAEPTNWTAAPYSVVGAEEYINVVGSERWSGLHKVKEGTNYGALITYTKVNKGVTHVQAAASDEIDFCEVGKDKDDADLIAGKAYIASQDTENVFLNALFSAGDYVWIHNTGGGTAGLWAGMWEIDSLATSSTVEGSAGFYVANKYHIQRTETNEWEEESIQNPPQTDAAGLDSATGSIRQCYKDFCYIQADITAMEDESFELDLTRYQANAIVYYLKGKIAEDAGEMELREYYMRLFKKQLEKASGTRKWGSFKIQGFGMTRK